MLPITCKACQAGAHDHCSGQVLAAQMPCDCEVCWGERGNERAHQEALQASALFRQQEEYFDSPH